MRARLLERDAELRRLRAALDRAGRDHGPWARSATWPGRRRPLAAALEVGPDRDRVFDALHRGLAGRPTLLVVEDLPWADDATLDVVRWLAWRIPELPCLLVLTYRDDGPGDGAGLRRALGALARQDAQRLGLRRLSAAAVQELSAASGADAGAVLSATGGNPLLRERGPGQPRRARAGDGPRRRAGPPGHRAAAAAHRPGRLPPAGAGHPGHAARGRAVAPRPPRPPGGRARGGRPPRAGRGPRGRRRRRLLRVGSRSGPSPAARPSSRSASPATGAAPPTPGRPSAPLRAAPGAGGVGPPAGAAGGGAGPGRRAPVLCLHTAGFMTAAVALYEAMGFRRDPSFDFEATSHLRVGGLQPIPILAFGLDPRSQRGSNMGIRPGGRDRGRG